MKIEKVAVIGAGLMGSGIAAQVANAGFPVTLLDIVPEGATNRNIIAESAVKKMLKPVKNTPLYICGESYSRWQAWVEGALETSDKVLEIID